MPAVAIALLGLTTPAFGLSLRAYGYSNDTGTCCVTSPQFCGTPPSYSATVPEYLCDNEELGLAPAKIDEIKAVDPLLSAIFGGDDETFQPVGGRMCANDWLDRWVDPDTGDLRYPADEGQKFVRNPSSQDSDTVVDRKGTFVAGSCFQVVVSGDPVQDKDVDIVFPCGTQWGDMCYPPKFLNYVAQGNLLFYNLKNDREMNYRYMAPWWDLPCYAPAIVLRSGDEGNTLLELVSSGEFERIDPTTRTSPVADGGDGDGAGGEDASPTRADGVPTVIPSGIIDAPDSAVSGGQ